MIGYQTVNSNSKFSMNYKYSEMKKIYRNLKEALEFLKSKKKDARNGSIEIR
jgi:hypothetical protein